MTVLGPGGGGVVVATPDPRAASNDRLTLRAAGIEAATVAELGLSLPDDPQGDDPLAAAVALWSVVTRRPALAREGDRLATSGPDGSVTVSEPATLSSDRVLRAPPPPRRVSVFGGAWTRDDDPAYAEALAFGRRMAEAGVQVICGGYGGVMEAVSRGAAEAGGVAVGIPIAAWEGRVTPNRWLTHRADARDLLARYPLLCDAEAWVAFPGGVGTLAEVAVCWNLLQMSVAPRPLLAVGTPWDRMLRTLRAELEVTDPAHLELVRAVPDAGAAAEAVLASLP